jgi:hypothetical protein
VVKIPRMMKEGIDRQNEIVKNANTVHHWLRDLLLFGRAATAAVGAGIMAYCSGLPPYLSE